MASCLLSLVFLLAISANGSFAFNLDSTKLGMATWSDARAVMEYQEFLASGKSEIEKRKDGPCAIVTTEEGETESEMAKAIFDMGMGDDIILISGQEAPPGLGNQAEYPIYITLPPTKLRDFLNDLPSSFKDRRDDFVFISGGLKYGNIEKVLKDTGYCRDAMTQFLATGFKTKPIIQDISTTLGSAENGEEKFAGECAACGKWAGAIEARLERNAIRCKAVFYREWRRMMWERNAYDAVFNLVGAVRVEPTTLLDVALYYDKEVSDMVWGISTELRGRKAITLTYGFEERMFAIGETTGSDKPCKLDDEMFPFMYEEFLGVPVINEYLSYSQDERWLLPNTTFLRQSGGGKPILIQGNLRADGAI
mmetsp:Transcript_2387/g.3656  ORF Transcript_2387/g.3656 Transcript_2387/m.3656 type:complete len:366 (+) Transcript_2387:166-1263(+)|eukprot:CAMPEP_0194199092 /NCGR_PEP_ID=MMETSP0156-20130528/239_1 /TAXON_ID=33649 /ORGANISM="Thalassionema nitzschioides, Strain L26-B" /LENGTH=365 /DNA_ID=CAMNT_0038923935 /DNA_START=171 /DNA_END=1268 /DNA_ORIENTATION=+